jgi:hypothetical protein
MHRAPAVLDWNGAHRICSQPNLRRSGRPRRIEGQTTGMTGLEWTPPAALFFQLCCQRGPCGVNRPRSRHDEPDDPLAYYDA